jgi:hypothetical protein
MSIASRVNTGRDHKGEFPDMLLIEPESAEISIGWIVQDDPVVADMVAELLLVIQLGIESGEISKTRETIGLLVELAFLESKEYNGSLDRFRATAEGRIKPDGEIEPRGGAAPDNQRLDNIMRLGEHLAAILENPETPSTIHDDIADAMNDLVNEASPGIAADARSNWSRIAEMLLAKPQREGGKD